MTAVTQPQDVLEDNGADPFDRPPVPMTRLWREAAAGEPMTVTVALADALAEAARLPVEDQNYLAWRIMEEIAEEKQWTGFFERNIEMFDRLAAQARQEDAEGKTHPLESIL